MKKYMILLFAFFMFSFIGYTGCTPEPEISYDNAMAAELFPELEGITKVIIETEYLSDSLLPGPSDIMYRGYIKLEDNVALSYWESYEWKSTGFQPYTKFITTNQPGSVWYKSVAFDQEIMPETLMGQVYFNKDSIWFEISTY